MKMMMSMMMMMMTMILMMMTMMIAMMRLMLMLTMLMIRGGHIRCLGEFRRMSDRSKDFWVSDSLRPNFRLEAGAWPI